MTDLIQINTTSDKKETLLSIADQLIAEKLAACVQIDGPVESLYRWQGQVESTTEWRCSIKTGREQLAEIEDLIRRVHHYDEPEIVALPIVGGSESYLQWIRQQIQRST